MLIFRETHCLTLENKTRLILFKKEMSTRKKDSEDSDWSTQSIQSLLSGMKRSVPEEHRTCSYTAGLKWIQWENVAFPPFSAEACQAKWEEILQKIRKTRSLTEIIDEAEETLSDPVNQVPSLKDKQQLQDFNRKTQVCRKRREESGFRKRLKTKELSVSNAEDEQNSEDLLPVKPRSTGYNLFCKEQVKHIRGVAKKSYCIVLAQRWKALTENQRKEYSARCKELKMQYKNDLNGCSKEEQALEQNDPRKKHEYLNTVNAAVHKESTRMPSDSEDEDITDDSSNEELYLDSDQSEEEEGEDEDMPFMF